MSAEARTKLYILVPLMALVLNKGLHICILHLTLQMVQRPLNTEYWGDYFPTNFQYLLHLTLFGSRVCTRPILCHLCELPRGCRIFGQKSCFHWNFSLESAHILRKWESSSSFRDLNVRQDSLPYILIQKHNNHNVHQPHETLSSRPGVGGLNLVCYLFLYSS